MKQSYSKEKYEANREAYIAAAKRWYRRNREKVAEYQKEYKKRNPDKIAAIAARRSLARQVELRLGENLFQEWLKDRSITNDNRFFNKFKDTYLHCYKRFERYLRLLEKATNDLNAITKVGK